MFEQKFLWSFVDFFCFLLCDSLEKSAENSRVLLMSQSGNICVFLQPQLLRNIDSIISLVKLNIFQIKKSLTHDQKKHDGREHSKMSIISAHYFKPHVTKKQIPQKWHFANIIVWLYCSQKIFFILRLIASHVSWLNYHRLTFWWLREETKFILGMNCTPL